MAGRNRSPFDRNLFICIAFSLLLPMADEARVYDDARRFPSDEKRLTREVYLRQGVLRGLIVKPGRQYDLQPVQMFLGVPYAAPPVGSLRFMPPVSAPPWYGVKMATRFAPVCPQSLPQIKKGNPPSLGRQHYINRLKPFLKDESEDCLYLNVYLPYREQKSKKFPVLVFVHGDSFEWSSGNPYDGRILSSYGNVMVVTINYRLGILGFMKPSLTEHVYGNNGLLDQLAALQWIKDNIEDLNGDPTSVTLMGHGTGAACINFLMLSPISNGLFHRAILMSGSALSDTAMTKDPEQYTLQVAQSLGCNPSSKNMMSCLQNKTLSEIKKVQILSRKFETPLGPIVAGSFIPSEPGKTMESFPNLLSRYQLLSGVTELESYHEFGVIELDHGILETQRDEFIRKYAKIVYDGAEDLALKEILKQYSPSKLDPQRWPVETNRDVILNMFSDARTLAPMIRLANYQSKANRQSYFYVFGHNSVSTEYAPLNKSVHGEEMPYVLGIPLGGAHTHFHAEYTEREKLLSEVVMRLWTNFVKNG
ncbi:neuroligin-4, Y-linked-like isoform X2 [Leptidea sinapis]|nr:neuroligin-4, Y-linked-like isoform X2 [Leptidea sinapis]